MVGCVIVGQIVFAEVLQVVCCLAVITRLIKLSVELAGLNRLLI